jgi:DNA-binding IclR family transcriptional regulator
MNFVERSFFPNSGKSQIIAKTARKKFTLLKTVYQIEKTSVNELMKKLDLSFPTLNTLIVDLVKQNLLIQHERIIIYSKF